MKIEDLKITPDFYEEVIKGNKRAELRVNDRNYKVGKVYNLAEYDGNDFTGRKIQIRITHILEMYKGLTSNYCMFSFVTKPEEKQLEEYKHHISSIECELEKSKETLLYAQNELIAKDKCNVELETAVKVLCSIVGRK